ncbi:MAG: glycosyltransferase family 2 protein [Solobacterium sp.]|nr:glycosyltransferase family 2 protein [Solobacterium sp.]
MNKTTPEVSVIIPVYNVESYLSRCLDSIINNTYTDLEIICVNDGSTDHSLNILQEYAAKDGRVIIIDQPNGGCYSARNAGLAAARGRYIAFIDADDWIHQMYFEILMHYMKHYGSDITICGWKKTEDIVSDKPFEISQVSCYTVTGMQALDNYSVTHGYVWARIYTRECVDNHLFHNITVMDDAAFNIDVLASKEDITCTVCDAKLYYYFQRAGSMVSRFSSKVYMQVSQYYYSQMTQLTSAWANYVYALETLKNCFLYRYNQSFEPATDNTGFDYKTLMKNALRTLKTSSYSSFSQNAVYTLLTRFPLLYRLFRIIQDPTMLDWEKKQKANNRKKA